MYIFCDIGGTKTRIAFTRDLERMSEPVIVPTHDQGIHGIDHVIELIKEHCKPEFGEAIRGIVVGIPATLTPDTSGVFFAPHLRGWNDISIVETFRHAFGCPVYIENDAGLCGLGEALYGAGKGFHDVAYLTVSTGVGGARIIDGQIHHGEYNSEPGHMIIVEDGLPKSLDAMISGSALLKKYGKSPRDIEDDEVWDTCARYLAYGLKNVEVLWSPECIVLGGGLIMSGSIKIERVQAYFSQIMYAEKEQPLYPELPIIRKAHLGDFMGLYGGMAYVRSLVSSVHRL